MVSKLGFIFINARRHSSKVGSHQILLIAINAMTLLALFLSPSKSSHTSTISKLNPGRLAGEVFASAKATNCFHPRKN